MSADPYDHDPDAMQGYVALIGAILQRALADSRLRIRHGTQGHTHPTREDQEDARALLLSRERLAFFAWRRHPDGRLRHDVPAPADGR